MNVIINVMKQKRTLYGMVIMAIVYEMNFNTSFSIKGFYGAFGALSFDFIIWIIIFGYVLIPIIIKKPDMVLRVSLSITFGIIFSLILRLI